MNNLESIKYLINQNYDHVFISYLDFDGNPVTKAMLAPRKMEGLKYLYFSTNTSSNKVAAYLKNNRGSVYFVDKKYFKGVSLIGTVEILTDNKTKELIWRDGDDLFYPQGINDPDFCVIKFTINKGRLYESLKNEDFIVE